MTTFLYVGQNAINIGHQNEKLSDTLGLNGELKCSSSMFIDDLVTTLKYSDTQSSGSGRIDQYLEIIDNHLRKSLESSASDIYNQNITIVADLSSSKLTDSLLVHVHDYFPHFRCNSIYLSSLFSNTGYNSLQSMKKVFTSLELCDTVMIRDTRDVVQFFEKENKSFFQQIDIDFYLACDIFSGYHTTPAAYYNSIKTNELNSTIFNVDPTTINWPFSVSSNHSKCDKIIDVRSSLWKYLFYQRKKKLSIQQTGTESSSVMDQFNSLRAISSSLASLHQSSFNPASSMNANEQDPGTCRGGLSYDTAKKGKYFNFEKCQVPYSLMSISNACCCLQSRSKTSGSGANTQRVLSRNASIGVYSCQEVKAAISTATLAQSFHNTWFDVDSLMRTASGSNGSGSSYGQGDLTTNRSSASSSSSSLSGAHTKLPKRITSSEAAVDGTASFEALSFVSPYALMYVDELCQSADCLLRSGAYSHM